jgi:hypothetical protein
MIFLGFREVGLEFGFVRLLRSILVGCIVGRGSSYVSHNYDIC